MLPGAQFYVGIDNKGLWPNLTKLPNGEIAAAIYNHPSHGYGDDSDVELWIDTLYADSTRVLPFHTLSTVFSKEII